MSKKISLLVFCCLVAASVMAQTATGGQMNFFVDKGIGIFAVIAIVISWSRNKSILWCLIHGMLGFGYIIYYYSVLKNKD